MRGGFRRYIEYRGVPSYVVIMSNDYIIKNISFLRHILKYYEESK
jgi:hypothetical protein